MFREVVQREIRLALMSGRGLHDTMDAVKSENILSLLIFRHEIYLWVPSIDRSALLKAIVFSLRVIQGDFLSQGKSAFQEKELFSIYVSNVN